MLEDNTEDLLLTKRQLKKLQNRLEKCADEVQKRMIEDRIINCKMEILEYQKEDYKLNGQIKNIELQEMREELDFQLENGMITQVDYNDKMDKLKTFSAL